jgi:hypothetical protein
MCGNKPRAMTCRAEASILPEKAAQGEVSRAPEPRAAFEEIILLKDTAKVTDRLKSISETLESTRTKEALARKAN